MELTADKTIMERFESRLKEEEKSRATIEKYLRDAGRRLSLAAEE